ncbi:DUF2141 domain-containing protein [Thermaurantiacus sp.]
MRRPRRSDFLPALALLLLPAVMLRAAPVVASPKGSDAPPLVEGAPNSRPIILGDDGPACARDSRQPAVRVQVEGLRSRDGYVRAELYPATAEDFLKPDRLLEREGKPFRRAWIAVPPGGAVSLCLAAPAAGDYALSVVHLEEKRWKFNFRRDGAGFSNNPRIGMGRPTVEQAAFRLSHGVRQERVVMNYLQGLAFRPLRQKPSHLAGTD